MRNPALGSTSCLRQGGRRKDRATDAGDSQLPRLTTDTRRSWTLPNGTGEKGACSDEEADE